MSKKEFTGFSSEDMEDVVIGIQAKGKFYAVVPKKGQDAKACFELRKAAFYLLSSSHCIVDVPQENPIPNE